MKPEGHTGERVIFYMSHDHKCHVIKSHVFMAKSMQKLGEERGNRNIGQEDHLDTPLEPSKTPTMLAYSQVSAEGHLYMQSAGEHLSTDDLCVT